jgi:hypothetical protein
LKADVGELLDDVAATAAKSHDANRAGSDSRLGVCTEEGLTCKALRRHFGALRSNTRSGD